MDSGVPDPFAAAREAMVREQIVGRGVRDARVVEAFGRVPRHEFVERIYRDRAYADHPIPIAAGQTISQPYVVAAMLAAVELNPGDRVLEVGVGSGYQTALLAELAEHVYGIERHAVLLELASRVLEGLGYTNITLLHGDGSQGWAEQAPYDAILVAAAAPDVPHSLLEQLAEGGRMIAPVGSQDEQRLLLVRKIGAKPVISRLDPVRFVPLIGREGFRDPAA